MKKSILALSAAVAVSGLGFAGAANALVVFDTDGSAASEVQLAPNSVGHYLFTPYFTTQSQNNTLLSVVNTDTINGKAVKVRFRGAANSDDVLDFTLFLSPGDVWTASLKQGADGLTEITSPDNSCTLPQEITNVPFRTGRLDQSLSDDALASHTREGYVEFLNMADIPPSAVPGSLYKNIKHATTGATAGTAPCDLAAFADVLSTDIKTAAEARALGLDNPTDGLTGGWTILRLDNISTFSGTHTAVVATDGSTDPINGQPVSVAGNFAFAPQSEEPIDAAVTVGDLTADPLLAGLTPIIEPLWMDLPDMSTPLVSGYVANQQASDLSFALAKAKVMNEYVSTLDGAVVPGDTDWVVSQPTRRYNVALDYNAATTAAARVFNGGITPTYYTAANTRVVDKGDLGDLICLRGKLSGSDREEGGQDTSVSFSPAEAASAYCGEVFTLTFNRASSQVLSAGLTNVPVALKIRGAAPEAGWATFTPSSVPNGLPMTGFAAISLKDTANNGNYGYTYGHRW